MDASGERWERRGLALAGVAAVAIVAMLLAGCSWADRLDQAAMEGRQAFHAGVDLHLAVKKATRTQWAVMADRKHEIQKQYTTIQVDAAKARYPTTMPTDVAFKLLAEVRQRDAELAESQTATAALLAKDEAVDAELAKLNAAALQKDLDAYEFRKSAKAFYNSVVDAAAGLLSGLGVSLAVP